MPRPKDYEYTTNEDRKRTSGKPHEYTDPKTGSPASDWTDKIGPAIKDEIFGTKTDLEYYIDNLDQRLGREHGGAREDYMIRGYTGAAGVENALMMRMLGGGLSQAEAQSKQASGARMRDALAARAGANQYNQAAIGNQLGQQIGQVAGEGGERRALEQDEANRQYQDWMVQDMAGRMEWERRQADDRQMRNNLAFQKAAWDASQSVQPGVFNPFLNASSQAMAQYSATGGGQGGGGGYYQDLTGTGRMAQGPQGQWGYSGGQDEQGQDVFGEVWDDGGEDFDY